MKERTPESDNILRIFRQLEDAAGLDSLPGVGNVVEDIGKEGVHEVGKISVVSTRKPTKEYNDLNAVSKDYKLFTLGPIYTKAWIDFSIPDRLATEIEYDFDIITFRTNSRFKGLNEWDSILEGVAKSQWDVLYKNVMSLTLVDKVKKVYWETVSQYVSFSLKGEKITLVVFMPSGNLCSYGVRYENGLFFLRKHPPSEDIIARANAVFSGREHKIVSDKN